MKTSNGGFASVNGVSRCRWGGRLSGIPDLDARWKTDIGSDPGYQGAAVASGDLLIVSKEDRDLVALNTADGSVRWTAEAGFFSEYPDMHIVGDVLFAGDVVLDLDSGDEIARFSAADWVDGKIAGAGIPLGVSAYLLPVDAANSPGVACHFDIESRELSRVTLPVISGFASASGEWLAGFQMDDGEFSLAVMRSQDMKPIWSIPTSRHAIVRIPDDEHVFVQESAVIRKFRLEDGKEVWRTDFSASFPEETRPSRYYANHIFTPDHVYVGAFERVIVLDASDGSLLRTWNQAPICNMARGIVTGDMLFAVSKISGTMTAYDRLSGSTLWEPDEDERTDNTITQGNDIFLVDIDGSVRCFTWSESYESIGRVAGYS